MVRVTLDNTVSVELLIELVGDSGRICHTCTPQSRRKLANI